LALHSSELTPSFTAQACSSMVRVVAPNSRMRSKLWRTLREPSVYWLP